MEDVVALMQIAVIPLGTESTGVGDFVADIELFLREARIEHRLNDMGTVIHGSPEVLFRLAHDIHTLPFNRGVQRVVTQITIDDRRDVDRNIGEKKQSVLDRLDPQP